MPRRYTIWAVVLPMLLIGGFEFFRHSVLDAILSAQLGNLVAAIIVGLAAAVYVRVASHLIRSSERRLVKAQHEAALLQERDSIARDMHDNVAQTLFYLGVQLDEAEHQVSQGRTTEARTTLRTARASLDGAYQQVRQGIARLRRKPAARTVGSLVAELTTDMKGRYGMSITVIDRTSDARLAEIAQEQVKGILQEALVNVAKHAGVKRAQVTLSVKRGCLSITVADTGKGFNPGAPHDGFGLAMMQERADLIGGTLTVQSRTGGGTTIELVIPNGEGGHGEDGARPASGR